MLACFPINVSLETEVVGFDSFEGVCVGMFSHHFRSSIFFAVVIER